MYEKMNKLAQTMGGTIVAHAKEKNSYYIFQVIAEFPDKYEKYTVWLYNAEFDGFYSGYYTDSYESAVNEFNRRLAR